MTRTQSINLLAGTSALVLAALTLAACGSSGAGNSDTSPTSSKTVDGKSATVGVADENLGRILVDSQGRTLYLFQKDSGTTSTCTGACATFWPPLRANGKPAVGNGASGSLLATTTRPDGSTQVTYNGHPLYRYSGDQRSGDTKGEGLSTFGGSWFALTPTGFQVVAQAANPVGY